MKDSLIPPKLPSERQSLIYASEADVLNKALFGMTAKEWREANPAAKGNIRDYATAEQLVVLANLESLNAVLIRRHIAQSERLQTLNDIAISQMQSLLRYEVEDKLKNVGRRRLAAQKEE